MGIIQKQSIYGLVLSYLGVILGFITTGYLMPEFLHEEEIGLLRVLVSYATLIAQFSSLGFSIVAVRMFPYFRDPKTNHHGFLGLFLLISLIGWLLVMILFHFYEKLFMVKDFIESPMLSQYFSWIIPLSLFVLLYNITDAFYRSTYDALKGAFLKEVIQKIFILAAIILYIFHIYPFSNLVELYVLAFAAPPLLMFYSLWKQQELKLVPDFKFLKPKLRKQIANVALFGMMTSFSGIIVINIDILMIQKYLTLSDVGIYTITFFFGTLIKIPARPLTRISGIVIAESFKNNDNKNIDLIYKKSSITLFTIAVWVFLGLVINQENIIAIIGENYRPGLFVIYFIGLSNVLELSTGVVNQILFNSKYYKYSSHFIFIFVILVIISNLILIPKFGIIGAALATLISKTIYMMIKVAFVKIKLGFTPYSWKTLIPISIVFLVYFIQLIIPIQNNFIIDIILRSTVASILFLALIVWLQVSPDINQWFKKIFNTIKSKVNLPK